MAARKKTIKKTTVKKTARTAARPVVKKTARTPVRKGTEPVRMRGAALSPAAMQSSSANAERLRALKLQLQAAQDKLLLIDPNRLDDVAHAAWSNEIFELARAINALRNILLEQLSADFLAELPDIENASKELADELSQLEDAVDVINAVAGVLGIVARIATLVA